MTIRGLAIATRLDSTRVHAAVDRLDRLGCQFDTHPQHGLQLRSTGLGCWVDLIESRHAQGLGRRAIVYGRAASTQEIARQIANDSAGAHGTVVVADHQLNGRGRQGNQWISQPGSQILFTVVLQSGAMKNPSADRLMLAGGLAIAHTVERLGASAVALHWPNDVYARGGKLAGVLVEKVGDAVLIGIGLNCNFGSTPPSIDAARPPADLASLGIHVDRLWVLDMLLSQLERDLIRATDQQLAQGWHDRAGLIQQRITARCDGRLLTGRVLEIDPSRGLIVELEQGPTMVLPATTTSLVDSAD